MEKLARLRNFNTMATRKLSDTVTAYVGQDLDSEMGAVGTASGRSQYLAVVLYKSDTKDLIRLRLSTVRKLFKFLDSRSLVKARRLSALEKAFNKIW